MITTKARNVGQGGNFPLEAYLWKKFEKKPIGQIREKIIQRFFGKVPNKKVN